MPKPGLAARNTLAANVVRHNTVHNNLAAFRNGNVVNGKTRITVVATFYAPVFPRAKFFNSATRQRNVCQIKLRS